MVNSFQKCPCKLKSMLSQIIHKYMRSEVITAVTMKNAIFWSIVPCGPCKNGHSGGTYRLHHQGDKIHAA
jgi:hypothetical protein